MDIYMQCIINFNTFTHMKYRKIAHTHIYIYVIICLHMPITIQDLNIPWIPWKKTMDWIRIQKPTPGARRGHRRWRLGPFRPCRHLVAQLKLDCLGVVFFNIYN